MTGPQTPRARALWLAAIVAIAVLGSACSKAAPAETASPGGTVGATGKSTVVPDNEGTPKSGGKLAFGVNAEPDGFDTMSNQFASQSMLIASSIYEGLTAFDADGNAKPYLAESFEPSDLAARWTIKARSNVKFHDGTPFDANAIKANLDAAKKGIGSIGLTTMQEVNVLDPMTVEVKMTQPWASFPSVMAGSVGLMISPATIGTDAAVAKPVGTGPFKFDRWDRGTTINVKKNPDYRQPGKPYLDAIEFRIITDPASRASAIESGDLDLIVTDEPSTISTNKNNPKVKVLLDASGDAQQVVLNESSAPFDNLTARKAIVLATDTDGLAEGFGDHLFKPIDQPFGEKSPYHQPDPHYPKHDEAAARALVEKYKVETGQPLEFTLTVFSGNTNLQIAQILQQQWAKVGIKAQINAQEQASAIKDILVGKFQGLLGPNYGYPDPDYNYIFWHSSYAGAPGALSINFGHVKSEEVDRQLLEGRVNLIPQKRQDAYRSAVRVLNENFSYVWLYRYVAALVADNSVRGLRQAEQTGFAGLQFRPWYPELWVDRS